MRRYLVAALAILLGVSSAYAQRGGTTGSSTPVTGSCAMQVVTAPITGVCSSCTIQAVASTGVLYCCAGSPAEWTVCGTTPSIASDDITPDMAKSAGQTDEYCLTYEATGDTWAWQVCDPTAAALSRAVSLSSPTNAEDVTIWRTTNAITVTELNCVRVGGSAFTYTIRHASDRNAAGTEIVTGGTSCASTTTGTITTSLNSTAISAGSWVWLESTVATGSPTNVAVTIRYTEP